MQKLLVPRQLLMQSWLSMEILSQRKQKTFETKENGKVISNNEVLVMTSKFSEQLAWAKKSMDIDSLSQQPKVAGK